MSDFERDLAIAAETGTVRLDASVVDLFSGAGGLSLGLAAGGLRVLAASDAWKSAAATYSHNFSNHVFVQTDARDLTAASLKVSSGLGTEPLILVGGPPCQGFSSAGARRAGDHRNSLVAVFAKLAAALGPEVVVFENVEGFLTADAGNFVLDLLDPLIESGYQIQVRKVNVANFGVPQLRKRVICIAALGRAPADLVPTHRAFGAPGVWRVGRSLPPTRTLADALDTLPRATAELRDAPTQHVAIMPNSIDELRITALKPGQTMRDLPPELWHQSYSRRANRRVSDGTPTERRGGAPAGLRRLVADEPSKAITSASPREFIHPSEDRPLTIRECARIQTFPDSFEFVGSRSDCATMIGNAVPPAFARSIARAVIETMARSKNNTTEGRLLKFDPTAAEGVSPALQEVIERVHSRYGGRIVTKESELSEQKLMWSLPLLSK